jgi:hypothetical protein
MSADEYRESFSCLMSNKNALGANGAVCTHKDWVAYKMSFFLEQYNSGCPILIGKI